MEPKKILFIASDRVKDYYGITSGLFNSASFVVSSLKEKGLNAKLVSVTDSNSIDRVVTEFNPDIVIIEALWVPPTKFVELLNIKRHENRRWIVRIHSKAPFLAMEGLATKWISEYTLIKNGLIEIAPNTQELTNQLQTAFPFGTFVYLPNVYQFKDINIEKKVLDETHIDIGCFGAVRPMKNTYQQALAAIEFAERIGRKLRFHINSSRLEQSGSNVLKNLISLFEYSPHELVQHGWYHHKEFLEVLTKMDICMQVSLSESFNIVTADAISVGRPVVVSKDIDWVPWFSKTRSTSNDDIVRTMNLVYAYPNFAAKLQKCFLERYNNKSKRIWYSEVMEEHYGKTI